MPAFVQAGIVGAGIDVILALLVVSVLRGGWAARLLAAPVALVLLLARRSTHRVVFDPIQSSTVAGPECPICQERIQGDRCTGCGDAVTRLVRRERGLPEA